MCFFLLRGPLVRRGNTSEVPSLSHPLLGVGADPRTVVLIPLSVVVLPNPEMSWMFLYFGKLATLDVAFANTFLTIAS